MSHWNYRFCVEVVPDGLGDTEEVWTVREVYFDDKGRINGFSKDPMHPQGSTWLELGDDVSKMSQAMSALRCRIEGDTIEEIPMAPRRKKAPVAASSTATPDPTATTEEAP